MMKKILQILCLCLVSYIAKAQDQSEHQLFVGAAAVDYKSTNNLHVQMQIGNPLPSFSHPGALKTTVGFPYGILYLSNTFSTTGIAFSKGYHTNKVNIKWRIGANQDRIANIVIYRKELGTSGPDELIGRLGSTVFEFDDTEIQGGVLYEYSVVAEGVSSDGQLIEFRDFIKGVGFRSPIATVSGSVSFEGGSPVNEVIVFAEANGSENNSGGSSLQFIDDSYLAIDKIAYDIPTNQLTLQSWLSSAGDVFKFTTNRGKTIKLYAGKSESSKIEFVLSLDGNVIQTAALNNAYPTGKLDALGNDIFQDINTLTPTSFIHISTVLEKDKPAKFYINGRDLTSAYIDAATIREGYKTPNLEATEVESYTPVANDIVTSVILAENYDGYLDEVRIWQRALSAEDIRRDYRRYIAGNETDLSIYLRMDENAGTNVYDFSRKGFRQNKNDGYFVQNATNGVTFSKTTPSAKQLGVFGVTDENGSYTISSISYSGTGESFKVTPSFGVHKFEPASQSLFLGAEASVVNQLNFKDVSAFTFKGYALYNKKDVFAGAEIVENQVGYNVTNVKDFGYNQYTATAGNKTITLNKGFYYYSTDTKDPNDYYTGGKLKRYTPIYLEGANVYIDGVIVIGSDNQPVKTDGDGKFNIKVPIGEHKVEIRKEGHVFEHNGFFPAMGTHEFVEDEVAETYFIDNTRVILVGRVTGGKIESQKPIGFGTGTKEERSYINYSGTANAETEVISSKNNIGVATITFSYDINEPELDIIATTNEVTGEYKKELLPLKYFIKKGAVTIETNKGLDIVVEDDAYVDLRNKIRLESVAFTAKDGTVLHSSKFHDQKSFRYNSSPILKLIYQEYEKEIDVYNLDGSATNVDISRLQTPIYFQNKDYNMVFEVTQDYINKDEVNGMPNEYKTKEYYNEGKLIINNNFATNATNVTPDITLKELNNGVAQYLYKFKAGEPYNNKVNNFANQVFINYDLDDGSDLITVSNDIRNFGVVKGTIEPEGTTYVTVAPETPDIILRDPPGSNSFATIEEGTTISFQKSNSKSQEGSAGGGVFLSLAPTFTASAGSPFFTVNNTVEAIVQGDTNFSASQQINVDGSSTMTYEFKQTISTSDNDEMVGADADLYIGNAENIYYGLAKDMVVSKVMPTEKEDGKLVDFIKLSAEDQFAKDHIFYLSFQTTAFKATQPTNTFFIHSQKHIIGSLIPELRRLANLSSTPVDVLTTSTGEDAPKTKKWYRDQAILWEKIIQDNEKDKYLAFNKREELKEKLTLKINANNNKRQERIDEINNLPLVLQGDYTLTEFDTHQAELNALLLDNFESNITIDAGVGSYTSSVSTSVIVAKSYTKTIDYSTDFKLRAGVLSNGIGDVYSLTGTSSYIDETGFSTDNDLTTTISYTLKDNDIANFIAVDVVNLFDGYGPIFITKGGATSCPHEGAIESKYYKFDGYNKDEVGGGLEILSTGTIQVYNEKLEVLGTNIRTNIPETEGAVFTLRLTNNSATKTSLEHRLYVDQGSLGGATTNIGLQGISVQIDADNFIDIPIIITKDPILDTYDFNDIRIYLAPPCDRFDTSDTFVDLNVNFKKACSKVSILSPENNWVFNINESLANNELPITFTDFNKEFSGFEKIRLEYRNVSATSWSKLNQFYGSAALKETAEDAKGEVLGSESEFTFNWDIVGDDILDGTYEIRAVSYCAGNIESSSAIITGVINLNGPALFGTPQPTDGILDIGEDISLRFTEAIFEPTKEKINVTGLENQQEIDHSVSVFLDGGANQIELPNQILPKGSFTLQFWFKNATVMQTSGELISQENGINATLNGSELTFSLGTSASVTAKIDPSRYNFYSLVYQSGDVPQLLILQNGAKLVLSGDTELTSDLDINSNASIFIGDTNVKGNMHDLRFWSKTFTPAQANVAKDKTLTGRELSLLGYWALDEGHGTVGVDKAKSRNAIVNLDWDIKPKGTAYDFANNSYISLEDVKYVQPEVAEDMTLSFWIKKDEDLVKSACTIFSNGRGNDEESKQTDGFRNKWSVNMKSDGNLELMSENIPYPLTTQTVADGNWHHIALVVKRGGSLNAYVDALETSSVSSVNIGGISGDNILIGARLFKDSYLVKTIDNHFTGSLDEIRLWNTARSFEQIKRDRYFEIDENSVGLILYLKFNEADDTNTNTAEKDGPLYNRLIKDDPDTAGPDRQSVYSNLIGLTISYTQDSPALKPPLKYTIIPYNVELNGDEMIIKPDLTLKTWALFEGEILNFSVARMLDEHFNKQASPITWSGFVNRQEIEWFTEKRTKEIVAEKNVNEAYTFTMDIVNKGGSNQAYTISGLPTWLAVDDTSGSVTPNATKQLVFTVDNELAMGTYNADIYLETASEFNDRLTLSLRVLTPAPDWSVNAAEYSNSMNIVSKIKINNTFSRDVYTKVGAFVGNEPRGEAYLKYDAIRESYFAYLTVYNNNDAINEEVTFKIWDALNGKILIASIDGKANTPYLKNEVLGTKSNPAVFAGANFSEQSTALNKGWTWVSFYVEDDRFNNVKDVFEGLTLEKGDQIKTSIYVKDENDADKDGDVDDLIAAVVYANFDEIQGTEGWFGSLKSINNTEMYKVSLANSNQLRLIGNDVDETNVNIQIEKGWNWLSFPIHRNVSLPEALSLYNPTDGDVIKDQYNFAIYDELSSSWSGTLNYMQSNRGYMIRSGASQSQTLNYPNSDNTQRKGSQGQEHTDKTIAQFSKYNSNMSVVAEVLATEKFSKVMVYDTNNILRGESPIVTINNKEMSFISVFSDTNDVLTFKLSDGVNEVEVGTRFLFESNKVEGNMKTPVLLNLKNLSTTDLFSNNTILYPNPFSNSILIDSGKQNEKVEKIEIYNTIGALVKRVRTKKEFTTVNTSNLAKGIYLIKLTSNSGNTIIKKMVKK